MVHSDEIEKGERFEFGKNWSSFIKELSEERIEIAKKSMTDLLSCESLTGKTFLDGGSGSGLFSLIARMLGAKVVSFDFDPMSVSTTKELKEKFFPGDDDWQIIEGSILDKEFLDSLGTFDVVYSWGVIHHTGEMWKGLNLICDRVAPNGQMVISIYNDEGFRSRIWAKIKKMYIQTPSILRIFILIPCMFTIWWRDIVSDLITLRPFHSWRTYKEGRGMSAWHDLKDWVGGYPFEVATPDELFSFYYNKGMTLQHMKTHGVGLGCNEFLFKNANTQKSITEDV